MGKKIDGKALAQNYQNDILNMINRLKEENRRVPCLSAIIVGEDGGSHYYLNNVARICGQLGANISINKLEDTVDQKTLELLINKLNEDSNVDGIMLFLPLPDHLDEKKLTSLISYKKDIDCLTDVSNGRFYKGEKSFIPCTPLSIISLIKSTDIELTGKNAVIIGRSNIVGKPVMQLLLNENCTVTICHSKTKNLKEVCSGADILISAVGRPGLVTKEFIKEGAIVIDVGTTSVNGKITGDVLYEEAVEVAAFATPVPGGVGSVTTTMLIKNLCEAYLENVY